MAVEVGTMVAVGRFLLLVCVIAFGLSVHGFAPPPAHGPLRNSNKGNLGGMKVEIPAAFASIVEYDSDPEFGENRKGRVPIRSYSSPIRGMFFEFRFPDMAFLSTPELREQKRFTTPANTFWMYGVAKSGSHYVNPGGLDRIKASLLSSEMSPYHELPAPVFGGLHHYVRSHAVTENKTPSRADDEDLYVAYGIAGQVTSLITCADEKTPYPACRQFFDLAKGAVLVTVNYRRDLIINWREIQKSLDITFESFAIR